MNFSFKTLRPGLFIEGVLARLDESTRDIILDQLHSDDERLAELEAAQPAPFADVALAELEAQYTQFQNLVSLPLSVLTDGSIELVDTRTVSIATCGAGARDAQRAKFLADLINALPGLLARSHVPKAVKWVSVHERLPAPRPGGNVSWAVLAVEFTGSKVLVAYDYNSERWVGLDYAPRITHWQPTPANPVAVEGAESNG